RIGIAEFRSKTERRQRQPCGIQEYAAGRDCRRQDRHRRVLDEPSVQLSWQLVAHLDRTHLQNFSSILEPGKPGTKHRSDSARSRLAIEMDRFVARRDWRIHDVLSPAVPKTNRRRRNHTD